MKIATVESSTYPTGYANMPWAQNLPGQTLDISVVYADGTKVKFEKLPANASVYAYEKAVVTETRELMTQQVESACRQSRAIIESVPAHQKAITAYEEILKQLSPSFAKEKETDERLSVLEQGLGDIKAILMKMSGSSSVQ